MERVCKNEKHIQRDNIFGITWCIRCGRLFNKPCLKNITQEDRILWKTLNN